MQHLSLGDHPCLVATLLTTIVDHAAVAGIAAHLLWWFRDIAIDYHGSGVIADAYSEQSWPIVCKNTA
jgi:hypothetical protein